jgi:glycosyltransferase 2 family protein
LRILPGLAVSILSLAVVFYFADLRQFAEALRLADYHLLAAGVLISLLWLVIRSFAWRALLLDRASFGQVFFTLNEGYLLNNLLPFRLGEVGRAFLLGRKAHLSFWRVLSSILIERALDLLLAASLLLSALPFVVGVSWAWQAAIGAGAVVLAGLAFLWILARNHEKAIATFERISAHLRFLKRLGGRPLPAFFTGLGVLTDGNQFLRAAAWMLLNWGVALGQYYLLMSAFFPQPKLLWAAFSLGVSALGVAAPSSPGAVGVMELSMVGALSIFGLDPSTALAFALTIHLIQYLTTGLLGAYGLAKDGESLVGLYHRLRTKGSGAV